MSEILDLFEKNSRQEFTQPEQKPAENATFSL